MSSFLELHLMMFALFLVIIMPSFPAEMGLAGKEAFSLFSAPVFSLLDFPISAISQRGILFLQALENTSSAEEVNLQQFRLL